MKLIINIKIILKNCNEKNVLIYIIFKIFILIN